MYIRERAAGRDGEKEGEKGGKGAAKGERSAVYSKWEVWGVDDAIELDRIRGLMNGWIDERMHL